VETCCLHGMVDCALERYHFAAAERVGPTLRMAVMMPGRGRVGAGEASGREAQEVTGAVAGVGLLRRL